MLLGLFSFEVCGTDRADRLHTCNFLDLVAAVTP